MIKPSSRRTSRPLLLAFVAALLMSFVTEPVCGECAPSVQAESAGGKAKASAGLGDIVKVTFDKFPDGSGDPRQWVLFLDSVPVSGVSPVVDYDAHTVRFYLRRFAGDKTSVDAWAKLHRGFAFEREVSVKVGLGDKPDKAIRAGVLQMVVVPLAPFWCFVVGVIALLLALLMLGSKSDLLRDRDTEPPAAATGSAKRRPFSLGLSQMAFWFLLVLAAYVYIGLVNWDFLGTITSSALVLMGISAATGLGAVLIDQDKVTQANALRAEQAQLQSRVNELPGVISIAPPASRPALTDELTVKKTRLESLNPQIAALPVRNWGSQGFFRDVLTDDKGISLHRFQILVWTLVLGIVFVGTVITDLVMPEFNATLLSLMGISAGTYLGFKFPEKKG